MDSDIQACVSRKLTGLLLTKQFHTIYKSINIHFKQIENITKISIKDPAKLPQTQQTTSDILVCVKLKLIYQFKQKLPDALITHRKQLAVNWKCPFEYISRKLLFFFYLTTENTINLKIKK